MNNSKKTIKGPKPAKKQGKSLNPKLWIVLSVVLSLVLVGSIIFDQLYKRVLITIDGDKYRLADLSYYFYAVEYQYNSIYGQIYGNSFWTLPNDSTGTTTVRDSAKEVAVNNAVTTETLYKEALANNYTLTDDENKTIATNVDNLLTKQLTKAEIKKNGFTKDYLTKMLEKSTLAQRYRTDVIDKLDIDDEAIKAKVSFDDYKQYDIEYIYASTKTKDTSGASVDMTEDQKKETYNKISALLDKCKTTTDWSTLVSSDDTAMQYLTGSFTKSDSKYTDDFKEKVMKMENNAISDVIENEDGYFIVRMKNNNSSESYDSAVKDAISSAESEAFQTKYQNEISKKHTYKLNTNALRALKMGTVTLAD